MIWFNNIELSRDILSNFRSFKGGEILRGIRPLYADESREEFDILG